MEEQKQEQAPVAQPTASKSDADANKAMAIIGYIIPILFFIPLVTDAKNSPFAKFHAGQQLNLLLAAVAVNVVGMIPVLGWFIVLPIGSILLIILAIMGIINAAKGEMKKLPMIGGFEIIK
jgi:uncharacterized membrane protein